MNAQQTKSNQTCSDCGKSDLIALRYAGETVLFRPGPPSKGLVLYIHVCKKTDIYNFMRKQGPTREQIEGIAPKGIGCRVLIRYTRGKPAWKYFSSAEEFKEAQEKSKDFWTRVRILLVQTAKWQDEQVPR